MEKALESIRSHFGGDILLDGNRLKPVLADELGWHCKEERSLLLRFIEEGMAEKLENAAAECAALCRWLNDGEDAPAARQAVEAWAHARSGEKAADFSNALRLIADLYKKQPDGNDTSGPGVSLAVPASQQIADGSAHSPTAHAPACGSRLDDKTLCLGLWQGNALTWDVIDAREDRALLLLAESCLGRKPYNMTLTPVTWEKCSLRQWLNKDFYDLAFSDAEKERILETTVPAHANPNYATDPGKDTLDKVFLLSISEAQSLLTKKQRIFKVPGSHYGWCWWLRSPGDFPSDAAIVGAIGLVCSFGVCVFNGGSAVRPALWIHL